MLSRRDLEMIAATSRAGGRSDGGAGRTRRGCLPGCTMPLLMFVLCGLPFDLFILARLLGLVK